MTQPRQRHEPAAVTVRLNLGTAAQLATVQETVRDTQGQPFLQQDRAMVFALGIAARVIAAGDLTRYQGATATVNGEADARDDGVVQSKHVSTFLAGHQRTIAARRR